MRQHVAGLTLLVGAGTALAPRLAPAQGTARGCHASADATTVRWGHPDGRLAGRATGLQGRPFGIRVSTGGVVFVTQQDDNSVARIHLAGLGASGAPIAVGEDPGDVVVSRDGATVFVSNYNDGSVHVLDAATGKRVRTLRITQRNAYRLALSPDDARLYVTSTDGSLYAVDLTGRDSTASVRLGGALSGLAIGRDGGTLIVSGNAGSVWRVDACTLAVRASATLRARVGQDVALAPDETEVYVADESGGVDVLDAATLRPRRQLVLRGLAPFGIAVTPDGTQLYVTSPQTGVVAIVDSHSGALFNRHVVGGTPRRIAFDATGATAVVSNEGNWVDVIR